MKSQWWRVFFLALVLVFSSCSRTDQNKPADSAGATSSSDASRDSADGGRPALTSDSRDEWRDEWRQIAYAGKDPREVWERSYRSAKAELAKPGADPSDIAAKANVLGTDPRRIFEFMRDRITVEPYSGVLRGPRGTLLAGAGNALDRALLAQELLKAGARESRLVTGTLSDAQTESLLARFLGGSPLPRVLSDLVGTPADAALQAEAEDISAKIGLPESSINQLLRHALEQRQDFWGKADARRATLYSFLTGHLGTGAASATIDSGTLTRKLKARLRQHYWLQVREEDGSWQDFDPTFSGAKPGAAYASEPVVVSAIPSENHHQLELSLVYRTLTRGEPREEILLTGTFASADALFVPLELRVQPTDLDVDSAALEAMNPQQKIDLLRKARRFQGILRAGSRATGGRTFDLDGNTYAATDTLSGNSAGSFFGDAFGGGEEASPEFVELRVQMRLTGPDREPLSQFRTLVRAEDVLSPTFAPPFLEWAVFLQPQWIPAEFIGYQALNQVAVSGSAFIQAASANRPVADIAPPPSVSSLLLQMALLRQTAAADILAARDGVRAFVDEPMLMISGHRLAAIDEQGERITGERHLDIVENAVRYVPKRSASEAAAFDAALRQSVADSTIEDGLIRAAYPRMASQSGATIIEQSLTEKRPAMMVNAHDAEKLGATGITERNLEWIRDNESQTARLVVATTEAGSDAWWSIRPDGNAILRIDGGRGGEMAEYVLLTTEMGLATLCAMEAGTFFALVSLKSPRANCMQRQLFVCVMATVAAPWLAYGGIVFHSLHYVSWALALGDAAMAGYSHFYQHC